MSQPPKKVEEKKVEEKKARATSTDERPSLFEQLSALSPRGATAAASLPQLRETKEPNEIKQWVLVNYATGLPTANDVKLVTVPMPIDVPLNHLLVKVHYASVDPYLKDSFKPLFLGAPNALGSVINCEGVGIVVRSEHKSFVVGDRVKGYFGWRDHALIDGARVTKVSPDWQLSQCLGVLGGPGATAYYGLFEIARPKTGDTLFVSAASGAVGALVGQLGKLSGCTVIGSVGSADKVKYCKSIGFDAVIVYKGKDTATLAGELKEIAPNGINCYFDNTGGPVTEAVLLNLCDRGRVAVCGQISYYALPQPPVLQNSIALFQLVLNKRASVEGFLVTDFAPYERGLNRLSQWLKSGRIKSVEDVSEGIGSMLDAFLGLFAGANTGKKLIKFV